jgi:hypothetical protein
VWALRRRLEKRRREKRNKRKACRRNRAKKAPPASAPAPDPELFDVTKSQALVVDRERVTQVSFAPVEAERLGFSKPTPWREIVCDFTAQTSDHWSGAVKPHEVLHEMFYVMNSNIGTDRTVLGLLKAGVSLEELQSGRVWIQCKTPWESIDKMSMKVVRMKGSGMQPQVHLGPRGILRVAFTVCCRGVWSAPVWVNVGALPFANMYREEIENYILASPARRLAGLLRDSSRRPESMLSRLAPVLSHLCKSKFFAETAAERGVRFRRFRDAIFSSRCGWGWSSWRAATGFAFSRGLGVLRFVTSTRAGAHLLSRGLLTCSLKVRELFRGGGYISVVPRESRVFGELVFCAKEGARIPAGTRETTLGGPGPCCVAFQVEDEYVWVNVLGVRHMPRAGRCSAGVYMYLFRHAMCLMRCVRAWVVRRRRREG